MSIKTRATDALKARRDAVRKWRDEKAIPAINPAVEGRDWIELVLSAITLAVVFLAPWQTALFVFGLMVFMNGLLWWGEKTTSRVEIMIYVFGASIALMLVGLNQGYVVPAFFWTLRITAFLAIVYQLWLGPKVFEKSAPMP